MPKIVIARSPARGRGDEAILKKRIEIASLWFAMTKKTIIHQAHRIDE